MHKKGDYGAISVTERRCTTPILKVDRPRFVVRLFLSAWTGRCSDRTGSKWVESRTGTHWDGSKYSEFSAKPSLLIPSARWSMCVNDLLHFCAEEDSHFQNEPKCKTFLLKTSFNFMGIKSIFISMALHLASLWSRGLVQLGNGLLRWLKPIYKRVGHVFELRFSAGTI